VRRIGLPVRVLAVLVATVYRFDRTPSCGRYESDSQPPLRTAEPTAETATFIKRGWFSTGMGATHSVVRRL